MKIVQGSVVSQIMLGGLSIYPLVTNFLHCKCARNYENWLRVRYRQSYCNKLGAVFGPLYTLVVCDQLGLKNPRYDSATGRRKVGH